MEIVQIIVLEFTYSYFILWTKWTIQNSCWIIYIHFYIVVLVLTDISKAKLAHEYYGFFCLKR